MVSNEALYHSIVSFRYYVYCSSNYWFRYRNKIFKERKRYAFDGVTYVKKVIFLTQYFLQYFDAYEHMAVKIPSIKIVVSDKVVY